MPSKTIIVTGDKELDRKLHGMESRLQKKLVRNALKKASKLVKGEAEKNLEQNDSVESGKLQKGLKDRAMKRSRSRIGRQVMTTTDPQRDDPKFGGAEVEFGRKRSNPSREKPFLRPAIYDNEEGIRKFVIEDIKEQIIAEAALADSLARGELPPGYKYDSLGRLRDDKGRFV